MILKFNENEFILEEINKLLTKLNRTTFFLLTINYHFNVTLVGDRQCRNFGFLEKN